MIEIFNDMRPPYDVVDLSGLDQAIGYIDCRVLRADQTSGRPETVRAISVSTGVDIHNPGYKTVDIEPSVPSDSDSKKLVDRVQAVGRSASGVVVRLQIESHPPLPTDQGPTVFFPLLNKSVQQIVDATAAVK